MIFPDRASLEATTVMRDIETRSEDADLGTSDHGLRNGLQVLSGNDYRAYRRPKGPTSG